MMNKMEMQDHFINRAADIEEYRDLIESARDLAEHASTGCFCPHMFEMISDFQKAFRAAVGHGARSKDVPSLQWINHVLVCHMNFLYSMAPPDFQRAMQESARSEGLPAYIDVSSLGQEIQ